MELIDLLYKYNTMRSKKLHSEKRPMVGLHIKLILKTIAPN